MWGFFLKCHREDRGNPDSRGLCLTRLRALDLRPLVPGLQAAPLTPDGRLLRPPVHRLRILDDQPLDQGPPARPDRRHRHGHPRDGVETLDAGTRQRGPQTGHARLCRLYRRLVSDLQDK